MAHRSLSTPDFGIRPPLPEELRRDLTLASGLNILAGLWLLASPIAIAYGAGARWNALLVGAAVMLLAGVRAAGAERAPVLSWLNMLLGVWLVASPFALETGAAALWNFLAVGAFVAFWAFVSATSTPRRFERERR